MLVARGGALGASFPAHPEPICAQRAELGTASSDHGLCWSKVFPPPTKPARPSSTQQSPVGCCGHSHLVCKVSPAACAPATRHTLGNNTTIIKCPRGTRGSGSSHREHLLQEEPQGRSSAWGGPSPSPPGRGGHVPCPALATALAGAIGPCGASCSCGDPSKHFCWEVCCSGARNK